VQIETKQVNGTNKETKSRGFIRKVNNFDFLTMLRISEDSSIRKSKGYNFLVDTFSVSSLSTVVFGANELFIAHISGKELLKQRALGLVLCTFTSRPYGIFRDWCFKKMKINENVYLFEKIKGANSYLFISDNSEISIIDTGVSGSAFKILSQISE